MIKTEMSIIQTSYGSLKVYKINNKILLDAEFINEILEFDTTEAADLAYVLTGLANAAT